MVCQLFMKARDNFDGELIEKTIAYYIIQA